MKFWIALFLSAAAWCQAPLTQPGIIREPYTPPLDRILRVAPDSLATAICIESDNRIGSFGLYNSRLRLLVGFDMSNWFMNLTLPGRVVSDAVWLRFDESVTRQGFRTYRLSFDGKVWEQIYQEMAGANLKPKFIYSCAIRARQTTDFGDR